MKPGELQRYRQKLSDIRDSLRDRIGHTADVIHEQTDPPGEHEISPSEGVDTEITRDATAREILAQVKNALARIDLGTFGHCQDCGTEIASDRLETIPYAALCHACERKAELSRSIS